MLATNAGKAVRERLTPIRIYEALRGLGYDAVLRTAMGSADRRESRASLDVDGPVTLDDQELMIGAASQGCGLAYLWEDRARPHLDAGILVQRLEEWCPIKDDLSLSSPSRRHVSGGLRRLIDRLKT